MCIRKVGASGIGPKRDIDGESRVIGVLEKGVTLMWPTLSSFCRGSIVSNDTPLLQLHQADAVTLRKDRRQIRQRAGR